MSSSSDVVSALVDWVRSRADCVCEPGLSPVELDRAETEFGLRFAPTWRAVLGRVHPVALEMPPRDRDGLLRWTAYPDWRLRDRASTQGRVDRPVEGLLFDVERNGFWWHAWGSPPDEIPERLAEARERLSEVPRLTPLWSNLFLADTDDSPVFSIEQADLYVPALTLPDLITQRSEDSLDPTDYPIGAVPFWSELHAYSQIGHMSAFGELADGGL